VKIQGFLRIVTLLLLFVTVASLVSCGDEEVETPTAVTYTVTFDSKGGSAVEPKVVPKGEKVPDPGAPVREGFVFNGWFHDGAKWNFATRSVREDMTLVAQWYSAEIIFSYEVDPETQRAKITKLKERLEEVKIPSVIGGYPVTEIGEGVFADLSSANTQSIFIPSSVTAIGAEAFRDTEGVRILFDEDCALTEIGADAFSGSTGLTSVPLGEGLKEIAPWCFSDCVALKTVVIPESVTTICENAFGGCGSLEWVMMSHTLTAIEDGAFEDCDKLRTVYFYGSAQQIDTILEEKTANMNDALLDATVYLYAETKPAEAGAYGSWYWDENEKIRLW